MIWIYTDRIKGKVQIKGITDPRRVLGLVVCEKQGFGLWKMRWGKSDKVEPAC